MLRLLAPAHSLIAGGLVVGLAATSTLAAGATPAAAKSVDAAAAHSRGLLAQDFVVDGRSDQSVFSVSRDVSGVIVPPLIVSPVQDGAPVTDGFGRRDAPTGGASTEHPGVDFGSPLGTAVHAAATGTVVQVQAVDHGGCGVHIAIDHTIRGERVQTVYCHLAAGSARVQVGQQVVVGDVIGAVGSTGVSTGPHLHFEVRPGGGAPIDPLTWLGALSA